MSDVTMVRIYLTEGEGGLRRLLDRLQTAEQVRGVTVFRGIAGFGASGALHTTQLIDLSLDLPLVVEFFDTPAKVDAVLEHLQPLLKPGHVVRWTARLND
jgi:PII-like signaling protein